MEIPGYESVDRVLEQYPREVAEAARRGIHPHEARPRAGSTFLHERDNWQLAVDHLQERIRALEESNARLAGQLQYRLG